MAVPKRRKSNSKTRMGRSHHHKTAKQLHYCSQCSTAIPTHTVCPKCGHYMGREIVKT